MAFHNSFRHWLKRLQQRILGQEGRRQPGRTHHRRQPLLLEHLEDRITPTLAAFNLLATAPLVINGTGGDTLVVNATSPNSGSYTLNGGSPVAFNGITSFVFNDTGVNSLTINNPNGSLFAPINGIHYNGNGHGNLFDLGGSSTSGSFTPSDDVPANAGTLVHQSGAATQTITFTGLAPVTDTVPETDYAVNTGTHAGEQINVVNGPLAPFLTTRTSPASTRLRSMAAPPMPAIPYNSPMGAGWKPVPRFLTRP